MQNTALPVAAAEWVIVAGISTAIFAVQKKIISSTTNYPTQIMMSTRSQTQFLTLPKLSGCLLFKIHKCDEISPPQDIAIILIDSGDGNVK